MTETISGNIAIAVTPQSNEHYTCELTPHLVGQTHSTQQFHGQSSKHAIAIALENVARTLRIEAEAEQGVAWDSAEGLPKNKTNKESYHVTLHYEHIAPEDSKFDAMHNTIDGNTVIENAELTIIKIPPDLSCNPPATDFR